MELWSTAEDSAFESQCGRAMNFLLPMAALKSVEEESLTLRSTKFVSFTPDKSITKVVPRT